MSKEKNNEYESILFLNKKDVKIEKKFEMIIKEINQMKNNQKDYIKNQFDNINKVIKDIKKSVDQKNKENLKIIDNLTKKINYNEKILKENNNVIQKLKKEIENFNKIIVKYNNSINKNNNKNKNKKKKI